MTIVDAILGGVIGLEGILLAVMAWWIRDATHDVSASSVALVASERQRMDVERARDTALAGVTQAAAERDEARRYAASLATSLAAAREEITRHVKQVLANGSDADVAAEVDRLLGAPVPTVRAADNAAGTGDGAPRAGAVQPPT